MSLRTAYLGTVTSGGTPPPPDPSKFRITLAQTSMTSAAVYDGDGSSEILLRTLWNNKEYGAGTHVFEWDQLDKYGNPITGTYGVDWVIKYGHSVPDNTWQGAVIGNTSSVLSGATKLRSYQRMTGGIALCGYKMFIPTSYAEGTGSDKQINLNAITLKAADVVNTDEFGVEGGVNQQTQWVCTDGTRVYWAGLDPVGTDNSWVFGSYASDNTEVQFSAGVPYQCVLGREYQWAINLKTGGSTQYCSGIAVSDTYLYVAMAGINSIAILNKNTGALVATNTDFTAPRQLSITGDKLTMTTGGSNTANGAATETYTLSGTSIVRTVLGDTTSSTVFAQAADTIVLGKFTNTNIYKAVDEIRMPLQAVSGTVNAIGVIYRLNAGTFEVVAYSSQVNFDTSDAIRTFKFSLVSDTVLAAQDYYFGIHGSAAFNIKYTNTGTPPDETIVYVTPYSTTPSNFSAGAASSFPVTTSVWITYKLPSVVHAHNTASSPITTYCYQNLASSITGYKTLETWQGANAQGSANGTTSSNNVDVLLDEFVCTYNGLLKVVASTWEFKTYYQSVTGTAFLKYKVFKRTAGGVETELFSVTSAAVVSDNTLRNITTTSSQPEYALDATDIIVVKVYSFKTAGLGLNMTIFFDGSTNVSYTKITPTTQYTYIVDGGSSQQVKKYNLSTGELVTTYGSAGGYQTGLNRAAITNSKFYFSDGVTELAELPDFRSCPFVMTMLDDSFWAFEGGCERLQHFQSNGTYIERIQWLPHSYSVEVNKNDPTQVSNEYIVFNVPLENPENWTAAYNWRPYLTADFYQDFVIGAMSNMATLSDGNTYCWLPNYVTRENELVRLDPDLGIVYSGQKTDPFDVIYMDKTGNLYKLIAGGNVGNSVTWQKRTRTGYSGGFPTYGAWTNYATAPNTPANTSTGDPSFNDSRAQPVCLESGEMILYNIGLTNLGWRVGTVKQGGSTYATLTMPVTFVNPSDTYGYQGYIGPFPEDDYYDIGNEVQYGGSNVYECTPYYIITYRGEFWKGNQTNKVFIKHRNGMLISIFGIVGVVAESEYGEQAPPMMAGNLFSGGAYLDTLTNKVYYRNNDEGIHSAAHQWVLDLSSFTIATAQIGGTLAPTVGTNLLADLPTTIQTLSSAGTITRTPSADYYTDADNYCNFQVKRATYLPADSDIFLRFRSGTQNANARVDIGITPNVTTSWQISGEVLFNYNTAHWDPNVGVYFQVLDDTGKVIADFTQARTLGANEEYRYLGNAQVIASGPLSENGALALQWQPFVINANSSGIGFEYDGQVISNVAKVDPAADWTKPTTFKIICIGVGFQYEQMVGIRNELIYTQV